jgi:hypothetical protein
LVTKVLRNKILFRNPPPVARSISERDLMKNMSGSQGADKANPKLGFKLT